MANTAKTINSDLQKDFMGQHEHLIKLKNEGYQDLSPAKQAAADSAISSGQSLISSTQSAVDAFKVKYQSFLNA